MSNHPLVSIIVTTKNSAQFLERCLQSLRKQTYPALEIIVVDNYSSDSTIAIAKRYTDFVYRRGPERTAQVNYGAAKAKGKYLYWVASDFFLPKTHVANCVKKCEKDKLDGILTFNRSDPTVSFWAKVRRFERDMYRHDTTILASRFFTKKLFNQVGGYNEKLCAFEDYDLQNRMYKAGGRFGQVATAELHLNEPKTLTKLIRENFYFGFTSGKTILSEYASKAPGRAWRQLQPIRWSFIKNWKQLLIHPILTGGLIVYKSSVFLAAFAGLLYSVLTKDKKGLKV
jgi:glycosyltransferase involved in cell wall biosynthesis